MLHHTKSIKTLFKKLLLLFLLRTASESIVLIKLNHAEKTLLVLELFKTASISAMITKLAGLIVLQRREIPQLVHSGNASSTMIASTRLKPLPSQTLLTVLNKNVLVNMMHVSKILNVSQLLKNVAKNVVQANPVGNSVFLEQTQQL